MLLTRVLFTILLNSEILKSVHSFGLGAQQAVERGGCYVVLSTCKAFAN